METFDLSRAVVEKAAYHEGLELSVNDLILPGRSPLNRSSSPVRASARLLLPAPLRVTTRQRLLMDTEKNIHTKKSRTIYKSESPGLWSALSDCEWIEFRDNTLTVHCEPTQEIYDITFTGEMQVDMLSAEKMPLSLKERAADVLSEIPVLFKALSHKETPLTAKIFAWLAVAYALSPIDLIPDFVPVLGYFDDILILPPLIGLAISAIPEDVMDKCREEAENDRNTGKKKSIYALPTLVIWFIILMIIIGILIRI